MFVSEQDTKSKWCPFSRVTFFLRGDLADAESPVSVVGHGSNRVVIDDPDLQARMVEALYRTGATRCLGSGCMAWKPHSAPRHSQMGRCGLVREA